MRDSEHSDAQLPNNALQQPGEMLIAAAPPPLCRVRPQLNAKR
jgi:hypothetical protein